MSENVKRILRGLTYMAVMLFSGFFVFKYFTLKNETTKIINDLHQVIILKDTTIKISEGKYSKLVNVYKTTKELKSNVEKNNKILADTIKKRNEKILSITHTYMSFVSKHGTTTPLIPINQGDTTFTFTSYYPKKDNYMAKFVGNVNTKQKQVIENWDFQKFNLGIILTQKKDGGWNYYIDAPEYAILSDVKINSLPQVEYAAQPEKKIGFLAGIGVRSSINTFKNKSFLVKAGVQLKNNSLIIGDFGSDKTASIGLLYKIK